jgi:hypothetical protein
MPARDAGTSLREMVARIVDEAAPVGGVDFDFGPAVLPDPHNPGGQLAGYLLIISCRSPLLAPPRIAVPDMIYDCYPSEDQVRYSVLRTVETLFGMRAGLCRGAPGQQPG